MKALRKMAAALLPAGLIGLMGTGPLHATTVSGDVKGDWTVRMSPVVASANCHVPAGYELRIQPGVVVKMAPGVSLVVDGTLTVNGTDASPVTITRTDTATTPWKAITIQPAGKATLTRCFMRGGGAAANDATTGMICAEGPATVSPQITLINCEVSGSATSGVYVDGGSVSSSGTTYSGNGGAQPTDAAIHVVTGTVTLGTGASANSILDGVFGVYNDDLVTVDASGQWWGSASGPQSPANVPGIGSSASDDVTFSGWVTVDPHPAKGDLNKDGAVTALDVAVLLRAVGGMDAGRSYAISLADLQADGKLTIGDAMRLARVAAGLDPLP